MSVLFRSGAFKNAARRSALILKNVKPYQCSFSTLLDQREHAEESRYIRSIEAQRQEKIRAEVERILALEEGHEQKEELMSLVDKGEEEKDKGLLSKFRLDDWKFAFPVGLMFLLPALHNEVLMIDAEAELVVVFSLFFATMYTQAGPMIYKQMEEKCTETNDKLQAVDKIVLEQIDGAVQADKQTLGLEDSYRSYCELTDQLAIAQADVMNHQEEHNYRDAIVRKLDSLQALEESAVCAIRSRMLTTVTENVVSTFANDRKAKDAALTNAMQVLASGGKGKMGKDVVGDAFSSALAKYRTEYSKAPAGSDPILVQLEKDMNAVATAPVVEAKGGNVMVTHPLV